VAIPFVTGVGAVASGIGAISPGLPSPVWDSDLLLLFCESQDTAAVPAVAGWPDVAGSPVYVSTGTPTRLTVRWHRAVAGEAAPTVPDAGDHLIGRILGIRGAALQGNPWNVAAAAADLVSSTTATVPGATTTVPDCLVVAALATGTDVASTAHVSAWANASLANLTEQVDNWTTSGGGGGIAVATGELAAQGAYLATTATVATANFKACLSIAIRGAQMLAVPVPTIARPVG
jgi:hypothetical protein